MIEVDEMSDDEQAKTKAPHEWGGSSYNRSKRAVEQARRKLESLRETVKAGREAEAQIFLARSDLDLAEARLSAEQQSVNQTNVPVLIEEMRQVTAALSANYTTSGERRVFEILSLAKQAGASGQSYEMFQATVTRIKNPASALGVRLSWDVFNDWIRQPAEAA